MFHIPLMVRTNGQLSTQTSFVVETLKAHYYCCLIKLGKLKKKKILVVFTYMAFPPPTVTP